MHPHNIGNIEIEIFICCLGSVAAVAAGGVALVGGGIAGERLIIIDKFEDHYFSRFSFKRYLKKVLFVALRAKH